MRIKVIEVWRKQWKCNEKGTLPSILCFHQKVHIDISFLHQLSRIGRPSDVSQVAGFEKSAFSLGRSQNAGFQAITTHLAAKPKGLDSVRDGLERSHLGRLQAVVLVEGR